MKPAVFAMVFALAGPLATIASAADVLAAVAANFSGAAEQIAKAFEADTGHNMVVTTGSTGKLYAQIQQGAPFDVLLSADARTAEKLEAEGAAVAGTRFTYAVGRLALWSTDEGRIGTDANAALSDPSVLKIAIANPELAPYGVAAREALQGLAKWDSLQGKIVMGENIGQTFAMVESGAAQLGLVALSAVVNPERPAGGSHLEVPQALYKPIRQDAVLLKNGEANPAAIALIAYLQGGKARAIAAQYGYATE